MSRTAKEMKGTTQEGIIGREIPRKSFLEEVMFKKIKRRNASLAKGGGYSTP